MSAHDHARIGPNAIIQTVHTLRDHYGTSQANTLLEQIGQAHLVTRLPAEMVHEGAFHSLVQALHAQIGEKETEQILWASGQRTADYLLAHRIPKQFQRLVRVLPRRMGLGLLLWAVSFNAWTFVGSGQYSFVIKQPPAITVRVTYPSVSSVAGFYGGTFTHLLRVLIDQDVMVRTIVNQDDTGMDCIYRLMFQAGQPA